MAFRQFGPLACLWMALAGWGTASAQGAGSAPATSDATSQAASGWPQSPKAPVGAPNVLVIMTDDVGFGASGTFGGPIPTPTLDMLANAGARYNNFHTTAICSPTRASLLTGRYPHNVNMGVLTDFPTPYPGYTSVLPKSAATVAEILKGSGYNTAMFGKAHITPPWELTPAGPFDRWPTGLGFEYYYGFLNGDANQWHPRLFENTSPIEPPANDPDYILDKDLANRTISWIQQQHAVAPAKPFFVYLASGTAHAPNSAPAEWMAKFRGKFSMGWDRLRRDTFLRQKKMGIIPAATDLPPRGSEIPAWDSLSSERKRVAERFMEAYAAQLAHFDAQVGRIVAALRESGQLDNTMIVFIQGDNGSSGEGGPEGHLAEQSWINSNPPDDPGYALEHIDEIGGPKTYNIYPAGWAWAMNTPFQWYKQAASHFGGTRNGLVISWPGHITATGSVRSQFSHVSDIVPTILEAAGVSAPKKVQGVDQQPIDGISLKYTFKSPAAPSNRHTQIFEMVQNAAIYHDGWVAATRPIYMPWEMKDLQKTANIQDRQWELYNVTQDFSQAHDLAKKEPARLNDLQDLFLKEAAANQILPIHAHSFNRPRATAGRTDFVYHSNVENIPAEAAPPVLNRSFTIDATFTVTQTGQSGVIVAAGGRFGGYSLHLKDGVVAFSYNAVPPYFFNLRGGQALPAGPHKVSVDFALAGDSLTPSAIVTLRIDGQEAAKGHVSRLLRAMPLDEPFGVGTDSQTPVSDDYQSPGLFGGQIQEVVVKLR